MALASLGPHEALYLGGRALLALLCIGLACVALTRLLALRAAAADAAPADLPSRGAVLPMAATALLVVAALLSGFDVWYNLVLKPDDPIPGASWAWLAFDLLLPGFGLLLLRALDERDAALARLAQQAITDPLTGLRNRRGFLDAATAVLAIASRQAEPVALISLDLDRFKAINDGHGHAAGDAVLRGTAQVLQAALRRGDLAGRIGGEEFVLLLPGTGLAAAAQTAERLRLALSEGVAHPGAGGRVTASFGVAALEGRGVAALEPALAAADAALYAAKHGGRDRVEVASSGLVAA